MNLDVITIQDCEELHKFKGITVVIEDGKVTDFRGKDSKLQNHTINTNNY